MEIYKKIWHRYWDSSKSILLEKSPPNLVRTNEIEKNFTSIKYLAMVRNPYAHIESQIRRTNRSVEKAAEFTINCYEYQKYNIERLKTKILFFTYEDLTNRPHSIKKEIIEFIPDLTKLNINKKFEDHTKRNNNKNITNLNDSKINKLTREQKDIIKKTLLTRKDLLDYFGYDII